MRLSQAELDNGQLLPHTLQLAVNLIQINGYVILEEVLPREKVDQLNKHYNEILKSYLEKNYESVYNPKNGFNDGTNHIRLYLPFQQPFIDESIIAHPFVTALLDQLLGEDAVLQYFATNTSRPGEEKCQPVHADTSSRFGDRYQVNLPISNLAVNFSLVDTHENNGPMEL
jgi:hypothetical protein